MSTDEKPEITLKNVDIHVRNSQETPCYSATLYVDGERFAHVRNDGHGGCDFIDMIGPFTRDDMADLDERVQATYPTTRIHGHDLKETVEGLCHGAAWDHLEKKRLRSLLKRSIVFRAGDGRILQTKHQGHPRDVAYEHIREDFPGAVFLNEMDLDDAVAALRGAEQGV